MDQNQEVKGILINEDLFSNCLDEYANKDLEYINVPDAVGIATEYENNQKKYIIYINNESGSSMYEKEIASFIKAVIFARELYEGLNAYYSSIFKETKKATK